MIKKKTIKTLVIIAFISLGFFANQAYALNLSNAFDSSAGVPLGDVVNKTDYSPVYTLPEVVGSIISIILSILGIMFIILIVYGGYLWMTAMGNETQSTKAKDLIQAAVIGLAIMISAYAISYFVTKMVVSPAMQPEKTDTTVQNPGVPTPAPVLTPGDVSVPDTSQSDQEMKLVE